MFMIHDWEVWRYLGLRCGVSISKAGSFGHDIYLSIESAVR
jgi:hypothetical protein